MNKQPLVILTGPTAVGKSSLAIKLAKKINGEIISADSMQVYRHMDIGSAKISTQEMDGIIHHLIDILEPKEEFNVTLFQKMCKKAMVDIYGRGKIPIIVGGTGFYIQSVLYDIEFTQTTEDVEYRTKLEEIAITKGNHYLHELLKQVDPISAQVIHENNQKKVIRALTYYEQTKEPISKHNEREREKESPFQYIYLVLNANRAKLYEKINERVDAMIVEGLVEEVKGLMAMGCYKAQVSMQGLGYKEIIDYLEKQCTLAEAIDKIKKETRHFAKRQLTWFRREKDVTWIDKDKFLDEDLILERVIWHLKDKHIIKS